MLEQTARRKSGILLVGDNPADIYPIQLALREAELDCELTVIDDGAEALAFARQQGKDAGVLTPELAVLDLNLLKNDGLELLEAMRNNRALADISVAVLSSELSHEIWRK